ncbi:hypothetical protein DUT91_23465 [Phyllobacterium salinisoli]|uniref:Uncharacterized protein n=1 Tax=Phyllobacterium salinisoli TaxID=1899321 RepID=A0A368JX53_9HYPH|nr:hypothetical protein [Phyllobacterium salinisoli]RCS21531.1 hypothetical protein DUT91_23465 [Phyllobacterium salinisoli]
MEKEFNVMRKELPSNETRIIGGVIKKIIAVSMLGFSLATVASSYSFAGPFCDAAKEALHESNIKAGATGGAAGAVLGQGLGELFWCWIDG